MRPCLVRTMRRWDMLETIWFALWGILWAVYFVLDGFDFGIGTLAPFVAKNESDKRAVYNSMGPYWKRFWDALLWIGNFGPALLFGVAFANLFRGILIDKAGIYHGSLFSLLNPYGLAGGILFTLIFTVHGALWLAIKSEGDFKERAGRLAGKLWFALAVVAVVFLGATYISTGLYDNYMKVPVLFVIPLAAVGALIGILLFIRQAQWLKAWFSSAVFILMVTLFGVGGMYPNLLISSIDPAFSLSAFN